MTGKKEEIHAKFVELKIYRLLKFKREHELERSDVVNMIEAAERLDIYAALIRMRNRGIITEREDEEGKKTHYRFSKRDDELESINYALEGTDKPNQAERDSRSP